MTTITWKSFFEDDRKIEFLEPCLGLMKVKFKGDDIQYVRCYGFMKSLPSKTKLLDKMVELFNEHKPKVNAYWHKNITTGESREDQLVDDYNTVYRNGVSFYFKAEDGSLYSNDLEWQTFMTLWKKRKLRPQLRELM